MTENDSEGNRQSIKCFKVKYVNIFKNIYDFDFQKKNRKSRVLYPGPSFLTSATWPLMPKKYSNQLFFMKYYG